MAVYQFAPDNGRMRSVALVPWGAGGLLLPPWPKGNPKVWQRSSGGVLTSGAINLPTNYGFGSAASDGASGAWLAQYSGSLVSYSSGGVASGYSLPSGNVYNGLAYVPSFAQPYVASSSGMIFAGSGATALPASGFNRATWGLATSGTTLFALASGGFATFSLTSAFSGNAGFVAYPFRTGMCLATSPATSAVVVGGWSNFTLATGYSFVAFASGSAVMVALGPGVVDLYLGPGETWSLTQSVTGAGSPIAAAWTPDGSKVVVTDATNGTFRSYAYSLGTLTLAQTLNLPNASAIAITPDGLTALVCQPTLNTVTPFSLSGTTWTAGTAVALTTPQSVVATATASAAVGYAAGIGYLSKGANWAFVNNCPLVFNPSTVTTASGNILAAGTVANFGYLAAASGVTNLFTFAWPGNAGGMIYDQGQIIVADSLTPSFWCFQNLFTVYQLVFQVPPAQNFSNLFVSPYTPSSSGGTIFCTGGGSGTALYQFTTPYNLEPIRNGAVGIYSAGNWAVATLSSGHVPTAVVFDTSGNVWAATLQDNLYQVSASGTVMSSQTITQFSGQTQSAPIGISAMTFLGSGLFGASSLAGPLVRLF